MNILLFTHLYPTRRDPTRGPYNRALFEALARRHSTRLVGCHPWWTRCGRPLDWLRVPHDDLTTIPASFPTFWSVPRMNWAHGSAVARAARPIVHRLHARTPFDAVLASWAYPDAAAAWTLAGDLGIPLVVQVLGSDINELPRYPRVKPQIVSALAGAQCVLTVSRALRDRVRDLGVASDRVLAVHNGVDGNVFHVRDPLEARGRLSLPAGRRIVAYVGHLAHEKGVDVLAAAVPRVLARRPSTHFVFVGHGALADRVRAAVQDKEAGGSVTFAGSRPPSEIPDWMAACDVLCLPSRREGCPNVILEALASGRPVVASRVGGIPELLSDATGIMVPPGDPDALAQGLGSALDRTWDPGVLRSTVEYLSWDDVSERYDEALQQAVALWRHRPAQGPEPRRETTGQGVA